MIWAWFYFPDEFWSFWWCYLPLAGSVSNSVQNCAKEHLRLCCALAQQSLVAIHVHVYVYVHVHVHVYVYGYCTCIWLLYMIWSLDVTCKPNLFRPFTIASERTWVNGANLMARAIMGYQGHPRSARRFGRFCERLITYKELHFRRPKPSKAEANMYKHV